MNLVCRLVGGLALSLGLAVLAGPVAAQGVKSPDEARALVKQRFGVEAVRVVEIETDGRKAFRVVAMSASGDSNGALRTSTLVLDAETGALVPQFRHRTTGYDLAGGRFTALNIDGDGEMTRRMSIRE